MSELNEHSMITRSKKKELDNQGIFEELNDFKDEINDNGDLSDIIDPSCNADFDNDMFQRELNRLRGKTTPLSFRISSPKKSKKKKKKYGNSESIIELLSQILLMNMVIQNGVKGKRGGLKKKKSNPSILDLLNISEDNPTIDSGIILDIQENDDDEGGCDGDRGEEECDGGGEVDSELEEYGDADEDEEEDEDY